MIADEMKNLHLMHKQARENDLENRLMLVEIRRNEYEDVSNDASKGGEYLRYYTKYNQELIDKHNKAFSDAFKALDATFVNIDMSSEEALIYFNKCYNRVNDDNLDLDDIKCFIKKR